MFTSTSKERIKFFVGDVVTLKVGGPRMTVTDVGSGEIVQGDWLRCQWFDDHGELRQEFFPQSDVVREPRFISPGSVHFRGHTNALRSSRQ